MIVQQCNGMIQVMVDTVHSVQSKMKNQVLKSSQNPREPKMTDETRERQLHPTEVDPFTNEIELTTKDWICLILGTVLIAPFRAIGVILGLFFAWFVAKIGTFFDKRKSISVTNHRILLHSVEITEFLNHSNFT